jgi:N-hydroxyarylamine O-acetyltransferase
VELSAYLARIGYSGPVRPDLATLTAVHRAHLFAIPYENLDVRLGRPCGIGAEHAFAKLVTGRRGGWCYEMNGLLAWALEEIGFSVTRLAGAVMRAERGDETIGNHLVLKIDLEGGPWIADLGLGDGLTEPIPLVEGPHRVAGYDFRLERLDAAWWRLHNHDMGGAKSFDFTQEPADPARLAAVCEFLRTSPKSVFTQAVMAYRFTPGGIVVLLGRVVRRVTPGRRADTILASSDELLAVLESEFGLDVPEAAGLWPDICEKHELFYSQASA